ncbi:MAG: glycosyltransferase family 2 protein [Rickettsiaceae bacterium]|nr:glycosyltransferase family 2 protein [Rickettsiaceae bacterium]
MNDISIVIVTYYTTDILFQSISSCLMMKGIKDVIIVNNGNPKEDEKKLESMDLAGQITLVTGHGNIGFSRACNLGAHTASGEYIIFMNPDCYTQDTNYAIKLRDALKHNPQYWFVTSLILNSDNTIQKTCRRNLMNISNALSESLGLDKIGIEKISRPTEEINNLPPISDLEAFSGALFACSKSKFHKVGGLSEEYFLHVEDMDLCMKIKNTGGKIGFLKDASIHHALSTSKVTNKFLEYHKAIGFIIYFQKFYPLLRNPVLSSILKGAIWVRYHLKIWIFSKC